MDSESPVYVFAYGSNLHERRMRLRVSTALPVTIGYVENRQLKFRKRSKDGSAKADAAYSAVMMIRYQSQVAVFRATIPLGAPVDLVLGKRAWAGVRLESRF